LMCGCSVFVVLANNELLRIIKARRQLHQSDSAARQS
jgi:hypothetical protein